MEDLSKLPEEVLTRRLQNFATELEELEEEQGYVLRQTGLHLPGHVVKKFESDVIALKETIVALKAELKHHRCDIKDIGKMPG